MSGTDYQIADSNGHFSFSFFADENLMYSIWPRPNPKYYFEGPSSDGGNNGSIQLGKDNTNMLVRVNAKGWIKYVIINEPPLDTVYSLDLPDYSFGRFCSDTIIYSGNSIGGYTSSIVWWVQKKNTENRIRFLDNIFVPALDTVTYTIKY